MLQLLALSTLVVFLRHPELIKPIQITRTSMMEQNELPTALAERNIPNINVNSVSSDDSEYINDQSEMIDPTTVNSKNGEYFSSYGMFVGRPLRYGKFIIRQVSVVRVVTNIIKLLKY